MPALYSSRVVALHFSVPQPELGMTKSILIRIFFSHSYILCEENTAVNDLFVQYQKCPATSSTRSGISRGYVWPWYFTISKIVTKQFLLQLEHIQNFFDELVGPILD